MKLKLKTTAAGPVWHGLAGQTVEVPDAEAPALLAGGYAERVEPPKAPPVPETAEAPGPETAEAPGPKETTARPAPRRKGKKE